LIYWQINIDLHNMTAIYQQFFGQSMQQVVQNILNLIQILLFFNPNLKIKRRQNKIQNVENK